jgi:uncharacterized membrane protein (TIGR02234 family)
MEYRKFKTYSLSATFVLSAIVLIAWSQTWFVLSVTFATENSEGLPVSGQIAAPGLSALGLSGFATTAALAISSIFIRRLLGVLLAVVGSFVAFTSIAAWSDPVSSSAAQLTQLIAISDLETLRTFVVSVSATAWPGIAATAGILLVPVGISIVFTASKWGTASRKFDRASQKSPDQAHTDQQTRQHGVSEDSSATNIDAWDSLSHGTDPTIN